MPNWCSNELTIKGSPKEIAKLIKKVEITKSEATENHLESIFSCHRIIPRPLNKQDEWYEWNVANWGTKWDLIDVTLRGDVASKEITYYFESAWSPIGAVVETLAKDFKKLSFNYTFYESGSDYWGEVSFKKGELVSEEGGSLSSAGCERLEYLMGLHHYCEDCYDQMECYGDNTATLCEDCLAKEDEQDVSLWEGETNDSQANTTTKDVSGF
jgi:hypothetical protein